MRIALSIKAKMIAPGALVWQVAENPRSAAVRKADLF